MKWSRLMLLLCLGVALTLAACGDDDEDSAGSGSKASQEQSSDQASVVEPPPMQPQDQIQLDEPLSQAPPKGKKAIWLQCELPACARYNDPMRRAADALGWSFNSLVYKNSGTGPAAAMEQAIARKPDYIAITGIPTAALKNQLKEAHEAGIKIASGSVPEEPSEGGWMSQSGGTLAPDAENVGKWIANDSGGKANVVAVTIPQFPVLNTETDWFKNEFTKLCSGCSYDQLDVTVEEVGAGSVPQKLVGYLQSHPKVDYVFFTFSDLGKAVGKVLESANLRDRVKLTGCCGDAGNAKEIASGDTDAWTISPNEYTGWTMFDAMARDSVGMDLTETNKIVFESPTWVVDSPESVDKYLKATKFDWPGPTGFEDQWKKLWQAGA
jgi:ABC-type sugar transport system substrate-binding protein